jgi:hypothetical protein
MDIYKYAKEMSSDGLKFEVIKDEDGVMMLKINEKVYCNFIDTEEICMEMIEDVRNGFDFAKQYYGLM